MMEEDFYATVKLKNGEEIFSRVSASREDDKLFLLLENPVMIKEIRIRNESTGYKVEPWLKTSSQDMFLINMEDVLTVSESDDSYFVNIYNQYLKKSRFDNNKGSTDAIKNRKMGYISNVSDAKEALEKIYKNS
jgi:hypothetical protein